MVISINLTCTFAYICMNNRKKSEYGCFILPSLSLASVPQSAPYTALPPGGGGGQQQAAAT